MEYVLSLSYGKDSLACLGAIEELGWQLDRIVHAEVWATDTIPADLPPMVEFKKKADEIILRRWGIEVERVFARNKDGSKRSYGGRFYTPYNHTTKHVITAKAMSQNAVYGFPSRGKLWCNSQLKAAALDKGKKNCVQWAGPCKED